MNYNCNELKSAGPVPLLKMEISRLEEENSKLRSRLENLEMDCSNVLQEKGTLQEQVSKLKKQISSSSSAPNVQISNLKSEVPNLSFINAIPIVSSHFCLACSPLSLH